MTGDAALLEALAALARALDRFGHRYMLIGGLAVIARGVPRDTDDIDATVWAPGVELDDLLAALGEEGITGRIPDLDAFARRSQVLLLQHEPTGTPLEISLAWLPFEEEAMARAETLVLGGARLPVAVAEDLVVYKVVAWRDRDRADVERLLAAHRGAIDLDRVRGLVRQFAEALDEPERVAEFERLVRRVHEGDEDR
jgi:predicted nucleotidyltransferase